MSDNKWRRLLAYVTGLVNQELLVQNEYLAAENRILKARLPRLRLCDGERQTLAEIGKRLGSKALEKVACIAKPDTILGWYRKLIANKFDGTKKRRSPGRPRITGYTEIFNEHWVVEGRPTPYEKFPDWPYFPAPVRDHRRS